MLKVLWWALPSSIREFIIVRTPGRIGRLPYWSAYFFVRLDLWLHFRGSVEVWPRHSFVLGSHEPFRSDLDLTIWSKGSVDRQRAQKIALILNRGRQLFPWIGESNLYDEVHAAKFMTYMNFFEFSRDPFWDLKRLKSVPIFRCGPRPPFFCFELLRLIG